MGSELLSQLSKYNISSSSAALIKFAVIGICNSSKVLLADNSTANGIALESWKQDLATRGQAMPSLAAVLQSIAVGCIVIDCTSNEGVAAMYPAMLRQGLHVVTPNKKVGSNSFPIPQPPFTHLLALLS